MRCKHIYEDGHQCGSNSGCSDRNKINYELCHGHAKQRGLVSREVLKEINDKRRATMNRRGFWSETKGKKKTDFSSIPKKKQNNLDQPLEKSIPATPEQKPSYGLKAIDEKLAEILGIPKFSVEAMINYFKEMGHETLTPKFKKEIVIKWFVAASHTRQPNDLKGVGEALKMNVIQLQRWISTNWFNDAITAERLSLYLRAKFYLDKVLILNAFEGKGNSLTEAFKQIDKLSEDVGKFNLEDKDDARSEKANAALAMSKNTRERFTPGAKKVGEEIGISLLAQQEEVVS